MLIRRQYCYLIIVFTISSLLAQSSFAQENVILSDDHPFMLIGKSISYIKDPKNEITFVDILSHEFDSAFKRYDKDVPNFGNVQLSTWNRISILNKSSHQWYLVVDNYSLDTLKLYYPDSTDKYHLVLSGRSTPFSVRLYKTYNYPFDLHIPKNDSAIVYLHVQSYFMQYPLKIMTREKFIEMSHQRDLLAGLYYGFLLFIVLYNLFLYFSAKEKGYLYYSIFVIFNGLMIAQLKGSVAELWGIRLHFMWQYAPAIIAICSSATIVFTLYILETKKHISKLHLLISVIFLPLYAIIIILSLVDQNLYASLLNQLVGLIGMFVMYATAIKVYRKGYRYAGFYIAACWSYFAGIIIYVLKAFTILPFTSFTDNAIEIGSTIQMIMFSFTLAAKVRTYKRDEAKAQKELVQSLMENERLIIEQNKLLETKVEERTRELKEKNSIIIKEKERSDNLLLNILPYETARELKENGLAKTRFYENVTVMFTDFKDFTRITEKMDPAELVSELDYCFKAFDKIMGAYDVEKIKTIGDSYMAVSGLPHVDNDNALNIVMAALELRQFVDDYNDERRKKHLLLFEVRIGIHTGPVIAGIVGSKKFAFDIWGDTVNTASRMESCSEPSKINISGTTYEKIKGYFDCSYRGKIAVKSKGEIDMYFVNSRL